MIDENPLRGKRLSVLFGLCFGLIVGWLRGGTHPSSDVSTGAGSPHTERVPAAANAGDPGAVSTGHHATLRGVSGEPATPSSQTGGVGAELPPAVRAALKDLDLLAQYQKFRAFFPAGAAGDAAASVTVLREEMTRGASDPVGIAARSELDRLRSNPALALQVVQEGVARIPHGKDLREENDTRHFWLQFAGHLGADSGKVSEWLEGQTRERAVVGDARSPSVAFEALIQLHGGDRGRIDAVFEEALRSQERSEDAQRALIFAYARVDVARAEKLDRQLATGSRRRRE